MRPGNVERLNSEPLVLRGCTAPELVGVMAVSALVSFPATLLVASAAGKPLLGVGFGGLVTLFGVMVVSSVFRKMKRARPDRFHVHLLKTWLHDRLQAPLPVVRRAGAWDRGRTHDAWV